jgi:hypothetical protein
MFTSIKTIGRCGEDIVVESVGKNALEDRSGFSSVALCPLGQTPIYIHIEDVLFSTSSPFWLARR